MSKGVAGRRFRRPYQQLRHSLDPWARVLIPNVLIIVEHRIDTDDAKPIRLIPRRLPLEKPVTLRS